MHVPFTPEQFLDVFVRYNDAAWPAPLMLGALAGGWIVFAMWDSQRAARFGNTLLATMWLWMAVVYHLTFFARLTGVAVVFAVAFVVEGGLFASLAFGRRTLVYHPRLNAAGIVGTVLIVYALIGYPLVGYLAGHRYPAAPTFGVPCPTTIFTFGVLLWSTGPMTRRLAVVPTLWAVVGTSAVVNLGMVEDFGLVVAALVAGPFLFLPGRPARPTTARGIPDGVAVAP